MKKIFKHLCLCLCLVMVGLLCFNAKPKASIFNVFNTKYELFPSDYEENSYIYCFVFSDIQPNTTNSIILSYYEGNTVRNRGVGFFTDTNIISYNDFDNDVNKQQLITNNETSIYMLSISNIFVDGLLRFKIDFVQYDYSTSINIDDETTFLLPYSIVYSYIFVADEVYSITFPNDFSLYYCEYSDLDTVSQTLGYLGYEFNPTNLFYLIWNYYNSNNGDFGIGPYISSFYNYSYEEYSKGVEEGLDLGFDLGVASIENIPGSFLTPIFEFIDNVFNLEVMPNVKIGYFIIIPLVFGVLGVVLYFWRKD